jgi:hypothetical protein
VKLTSGEIFNAKEPLGRLLKEKLPVKVAFGLAKIAKKLDDQLVAINQVREGLFRTYGELDNVTHKWIVRPYIDDGAGNAIRNPKVIKFEEEQDELMAQETEIVYETVKLPDTLEIEPYDLMMLEKFVK